MLCTHEGWRKKTWEGICSIACAGVELGRFFIKFCSFFSISEDAVPFHLSPLQHSKTSTASSLELKFRSINKNIGHAPLKLFLNLEKNAQQSKRSSARYVIGIMNSGKLICLLAICKADVSRVAKGTEA